MESQRRHRRQRRQRRRQHRRAGGNIGDVGSAGRRRDADVGGARGDTRVGTSSAGGGAAYGGDARGGGACGKPAEEERGPAADSDGRSLLTTVPRHPKLGRVTHLCPQGPIANGLGSDWCEERDVGRSGLQRVEGADIRRAGPTWAAGQELAVGRQRYADSVSPSDLQKAHFQLRCTHY